MIKGIKLFKTDIERDATEAEKKLMEIIFKTEMNFECKLKPKEDRIILESEREKMVVYIPVIMYTLPYTLRPDHYNKCTQKLFSGFYIKGTDIFDIYVNTVEHIDGNFKKPLKANPDDILIALMMLKETEGFIMRRFTGARKTVENYVFSPEKEVRFIKNVLELKVSDDAFVEIDYPDVKEIKEEFALPWAYIEDAVELSADIREVPSLALKFAKAIKSPENLSEEETAHIVNIIKKLRVEEYLKVYSELTGKKLYSLSEAIKSYIYTVNLPKIVMVENFINSRGKSPCSLEEKTKHCTNYKYTDTYIDSLKFEETGENPVNFKLLSEIMSVPIDKYKQMEVLFSSSRYKKGTEFHFNKDAGLYNILHIINMLSFHYIQIGLESGCLN